MTNKVNILIVEDDVGHATLIKKNLQRVGISNDIQHFLNGEDLLNYLFKKNKANHLIDNEAYLILLDIRMPKISGIEVLKIIKADDILCKIPIIMISTTDDTKEIELCHKYGCNNFIKKPVDYNQFVEAMKKLGLFLMIVEIPKISKD